MSKSSRISDLSLFIGRLTRDERWQVGLDESERRLCIGFVVDALILAKNQGWDIERMYERALGAIMRFGGREVNDGSTQE